MAITLNEFHLLAQAGHIIGFGSMDKQPLEGMLPDGRNVKQSELEEMFSDELKEFRESGAVAEVGAPEPWEPGEHQ